ncbi:MAG: hypothetical protein Q7K26_02155 [bacterium]|nr:hypothetical protein [bacterium]
MEQVRGQVLTPRTFSFGGGTVVETTKTVQPYAYEVIVRLSGTNEVTRKELLYEKPDIQENRHYDYEVRELFTST